MKRLVSILAVLLALAATTPLYAHHAAEGTVDDEVWLMIDSMIADTPHADMVLDPDSETGMWLIDITVPSARSLETMIDDGFLIYVDMLDNVSGLTIEFNDDRTVTMTVEDNSVDMPSVFE